MWCQERLENNLKDFVVLNTKVSSLIPKEINKADIEAIIKILQKDLSW